MKVAYGSDFHFEFYDFSTTCDMINSWEFDEDTDILVIAGDLDVGAKNVIYWLNRIYRTHGIYIVYVPGNHEFYQSSINEQSQIFNHYSRNFTILSPSSSLITSDIKFVGVTGWCDGSFQFCNPVIHRQYNDFYQISDFAHEHLILGIHERKKLQDTIKSSHIYSAVVVVTHMMPIPECIPTRFVGNQLNACFTNDWRHLMRECSNITHWICGHSHDKNHVTYQNTEILMNPYGYPNENTEGWEWEYFTIEE